MEIPVLPCEALNQDNCIMPLLEIYANRLCWYRSRIKIRGKKNPRGLEVGCGAKLIVVGNLEELLVTYKPEERSWS